MKTISLLALALCASVASHALHAADVAGVSASEIVVGHISDLSGPIAMLGIPVRDGMLMRFDEANAAGGVHGRQLRLVVEDAAYDPKRGVLAARKLVQRDQAFAFIATMGTPVVMATMPVVLDAGRLHLFPFSPQTRWWRKYVVGDMYRATEIRRFPFRLKFEPPPDYEGDAPGANINTVVAIYKMNQ